MAIIKVKQYLQKSDKMETIEIQGMIYKRGHLGFAYYMADGEWIKSSRTWASLKLEESER